MKTWNVVLHTAGHSLLKTIKLLLQGTRFNLSFLAAKLLDHFKRTHFTLPLLFSLSFTFLNQGHEESCNYNESLYLGFLACRTLYPLTSISMFFMMTELSELSLLKIKKYIWFFVYLGCCFCSFLLFFFWRTQNTHIKWNYWCFCHVSIPLWNVHVGVHLLCTLNF